MALAVEVSAYAMRTVPLPQPTPTHSNAPPPPHPTPVDTSLAHAESSLHFPSKCGSLSNLHAQIDLDEMGPFLDRCSEEATTRFGGPLGIMTQIVRGSLSK